jgi:hypothetical protein
MGLRRCPAGTAAPQASALAMVRIYRVPAVVMPRARLSCPLWGGGGASSRWRCRRASSSPLGPRTTRHPRCSPVRYRRTLVRHFGPSRRSVLARRWRRCTGRREASTTRVSTPWATRTRCRQNPSRPASSPLTTRVWSGSPQRGLARALSTSTLATAPAGTCRSRGRCAAPVVKPRRQVPTPTAQARNRVGVPAVSSRCGVHARVAIGALLPLATGLEGASHRRRF